MGRFGNTLLVNGQTSFNLQAKKGEVVRFYLTNVANVRPFKMTIPGLKLKLIGGDNSAYEQETLVEEVTIAPSERYTVDVFFEQAGTYKLMHTHPDKQYTLGAITVSNEAVAVSYEQAFQSLRQHPLVSAEMDAYRTYFDQEPDKLLTIAVETQKLMDDLHHSGAIFNIPCHQMSDGQWMGNCTEADMHAHEEPLPIEWEDTMDAMNSISNKENVTWQLLDQQTGQINEQIKWHFQVGDKAKIRIFNDPESEHPMQHPIHFHGQSFLVLARNGQANDNLVWKDTVLIPTGETVDILLHVTNPGQWMAHCHISEHFEDGMVLEYEVSGEDLAGF
jgi:suppressor of ftsI